MSSEMANIDEVYADIVYLDIFIYSFNVQLSMTKTLCYLKCIYSIHISLPTCLGSIVSQARCVRELFNYIMPSKKIYSLMFD